MKKHTQDSLSTSIIFRRKENINNKKIKLSILKDKLCSILIRKYNNVFVEKKYNKDSLLKDLEFLTKNVELDNMLFDRLVLEIERVVLMKVIKGRDIIPEDNIIVINNSKPYARVVNKSVDVGKFIEDTNKSPHINNKNTPEETLISKPNCSVERNITKTDLVLNSSFSPTKKTGLLEKLIKNQQDDWGLIAKYNYLKDLEDKRNQKERQKSLNKSVMKGLEIQIMEKKQKKVEEAEKENNYFVEQENTLKKLEKEQNIVDLKRKQFYLKEREMRDNLLRISLERKKIEKEKDKLEDKKYIEIIQKGLLEDENIKKIKKEKEKVFNKEFMDDVEKKINEKNINKEKERIQTKKQFEEYFNQHEQKEIERERLINLKKEKIKAYVNRYDNMVNLKEIDKKIEKANDEKIEKERLVQEKEELERKKQEKGKIDNLKKEMITTLRQQIEEKKVKISVERKMEEKYDKEMLRDIDDFNRKKFEKEEMLRKTCTNYRKDLNRQLEEKITFSKLNEKDEKEILLSRDLIKHIKSSPLLNKISHV